MTECDQSRNYGTCTRAKHHIEFPVQRPTNHGLNLFEDTQSVEAFGPTTI